MKHAQKEGDKTALYSPQSRGGRRVELAGVPQSRETRDWGTSISLSPAFAEAASRRQAAK